MINKKIYFWPHTTSAKIASYRLRCKLIANELIKMFGTNINIGLKPNGDIDILLLSKRYDTLSLNKALELKHVNGTKLILDICDNHFILGSTDQHSFSRCNQLITAINSVDQVTTSSEFLKKVILKYCSPIAPVIVISDIVDTNNVSVFEKVYNWRAYLKFLNLKFMFSQGKSFRLIWFGNHQGSYDESGMVDLLRIKFDFSLTILSNSKTKFDSIFSNWTIKVYYLDWNHTYFRDILRLHDISIIPSSQNDFTYSKSDNRVTTSLANNLKVITDPIPSYLKHEDLIYIDNWENSLISCFSDSGEKNNQFDTISHNLSIIKKWSNVIMT